MNKLAVKKAGFIPTIDCAMIELVIGENSFIMDTANQITVEPTLETTEAIPLNIKGVIRAQKRETSTLTGHTITLTDNGFSPELVQALQGGTFVYDTTDQTKLKSYTPPVAGALVTPTSFSLISYSAVYDAAGMLVEYEKTTYPNCQGQPIAFNSEDGTFRAPQYTITSAPKQGEAPYKIEWVEDLPTVSTGS